ncbi:MAG: hypothetical protein Ct9H300mP16_10740 [Pseudomonadota bacterium]|nr:MAG: hypothetical protein Ct9H300mP16_10740 [Pseudomonadota bacterium]
MGLTNVRGPSGLSASGLGAADALRFSSNVNLGAEWLSVPEDITFPTSGGERAHAYYYPPANPEFRLQDLKHHRCS